jgi:hypothetical protein
MNSSQRDRQSGLNPGSRFHLHAFSLLSCVAFSCGLVGMDDFLIEKNV